MNIDCLRKNYKSVQQLEYHYLNLVFVEGKGYVPKYDTLDFDGKIKHHIDDLSMRVHGIYMKLFGKLYEDIVVEK